MWLYFDAIHHDDHMQSESYTKSGICFHYSRCQRIVDSTMIRLLEFFPFETLIQLALQLRHMVSDI